MKLKDVLPGLSLLAVVLTAAITGCAPTGVVADRGEVVQTPVSQSQQDAPAAPGDVSPNPTAIPVAEPTTAPVVPGEGVSEDSEPGEEKEADVTADWPVLRDEMYGFQVAYPPTRGFMDLPVHDSGDGGPPTIIQRFVILYPQEWEERLRPGGEPDPTVASYPALSIEVCSGTLEQYRREFMELGNRKEIEINGLTALYEQDTYDDYNMTRYVFQHPTNDQLRITLSDAVSGFSVRVQESGDVASLIPVVASTFAFFE